MTSAVQTAHKGIGGVYHLASAMGCIFRPQPEPDEGIDAHLEFTTSGGRPNGRLLGVQVKSGPWYFRSETEAGWRLTVKAHNRQYWKRYSLPVIVVVYDPGAKRAYWQVVRDDLQPTTPSGGSELLIPRDQPFDDSAREHLERVAEGALPDDPVAAEAAVREHRAELAVGWMRMLRRGSRLVLELEESKGDGTARLISEEADADPRVEEEWSWLLDEGISPEAEFAELFPWADVTIDAEHYREQTRAEFYADTGGDEDASFDEWFADHYAGRLKPYARLAQSGTALWRLELALNAFGTAALDADDQADQDDALFTFDQERLLAHQRAVGYYANAVADFPPARTAEQILFFGDEDAVPEVVGFEDILWSDPSAWPQAAASILEHALEREPSEALVAGFVVRFRPVLETDDVWHLPFAELREWLDEVKVTV